MTDDTRARAARLAEPSDSEWTLITDAVPLRERVDEALRAYGIRVALDAMRDAEARVADLQRLCERLKQEAQVHGHEARAQRATVQECYQAVGAQVGDWHGAEPIRAKVVDLQRQLDEAQKAIDLERSYVQDEIAGYRSQLAAADARTERYLAQLAARTREGEALREALQAAENVLACLLPGGWIVAKRQTPVRGVGRTTGEELKGEGQDE